MFIRSERLFLRPGWPEDWEELLAQINDARVVCNLVKAPWPYTADDARAFAAQPQERMFPHFLITLPTSDGAKLIGSVGLGKVDQHAELGYWIARGHWGQGYASEAARAVLRLAVTLGHRRIVASHFADNPASANVLHKLGFTLTGEMHVRHSLGRSGEALAHGYALELCGTVGSDDGNAVMAQRAA